MLLGADGYGLHLGGPAGLVQGVGEGHLPVPGVALPRSPVALDFMSRSTGSHDTTVVHVDYEDLGRLRRAICSGN